MATNAVKVVCAFCLLAYAANAQPEGEEMMVTPFSEILAKVLQHTDSMNQAGAQQQVITHGPQGGFEIQFDFNNDDQTDEFSQEESDTPFSGQMGGAANIFGRMFKRMREMRERMEGQMLGGKGNALRQAEERDSKSPFSNYLQNKVKRKLYNTGDRLLDDCEHELESCPEATHPESIMSCLKGHAHELSPQCEDELDEAEEKLEKAQAKVNSKHRRITMEMQRMCEDELPMLCGLPEAKGFTLFQRVMRTQNLLDNKLACLVKNLPELTPESDCHKLVQSFATHWGEFEVKDAKESELAANLADKCGEDLAANTECQKRRCPYGKLKCLTTSTDALSADCSQFVTMRIAVLDAQTSKDEELKNSHKSCKQAFNDAMTLCKETADMSGAFSCIDDAKQVMSNCLEEGDARFAAAVMPKVKHHHDHRDHSDDESSSDKEEQPWWKQEETKWTKKLKSVKELFVEADSKEEHEASSDAEPQEIFVADKPALAPRQQPPDHQIPAVIQQFHKHNVAKPVFDDEEVIIADENNEVADQAMMIAFGTLLMLVVVGLLCMVVKRTPQHYELEAMHMSIQGSGTSHDQV